MTTCAATRSLILRIFKINIEPCLVIIIVYFNMKIITFNLDINDYEIRLHSKYNAVSAIIASFRAGLYAIFPSYFVLLEKELIDTLLDTLNNSFINHRVWLAWSKCNPFYVTTNNLRRLCLKTEVLLFSFYKNQYGAL